MVKMAKTGECMENIAKQKNISVHDAFLKIGQLYRKGYLPLIDGIITKEKYTKIEVKYSYGCKGEITSLFDNEYFYDISLDEENCSLIDGHIMEHKDFIIHYGEGSNGGDGFIVVMDKMDNIHWIMFHSYINPIEKIETENNKVIGVNNCNASFEFEINL